MPEMKDFLLVWAAVPIALVSEQDSAQEMASAKEAAGILIQFLIVFLHFLQQPQPNEPVLGCFEIPEGKLCTWM